MAKVDMTVTVEPSAITRFLFKYWVLGLIVSPFLGLVPKAWLVSVATKDVRNG